MNGELQIPSAVAEPWLGDVGPLLSQVGSPEGLSALTRAAGAPEFRQVTSVASLRAFLADYRRRILCPLELPVVAEAFGHAVRFEPRELLALDARLADEPFLHSFAAASRHAGRSQLRRLAPLRDQRMVQRYVAAVRAGRAHGWHTVVYGLILAVYSVPLRQGLVHYAAQTTRGFVQSASSLLRLDSEAAGGIVEESLVGVGEAVDGLLRANGAAGCGVVVV